MSWPKLLDLYCGAGGAAMGYHQAGFDVVGVDIDPQPNYPFEFVQADALEFLAWRTRHTDRRVDDAIASADVIHASPPCQDHSTLSAMQPKGHGTGWLLPASRELLVHTRLPYVIENVVGADMINPVTLCGSSFGLGVRRHRLFELSWAPGFVPPCAHYLQPAPIDVTGTGGPRLGDRLDAAGGSSRKPRNLAEARNAMGINWMTRVELSQAIPPAYTAWVGQSLLESLVVADVG